MSETPLPPAEQPIDPWLIERLLADQATARDADEQALAFLFAALRAPAAPAELAEQETYLAAFAAAQEPRSAPPRSKPVLATLLATKTVAAGFALVTAAGTAAAAYSGTLPAALQDVAHRRVGAPAAHLTHEAKPSSARPTVAQTSSAAVLPPATSGPPGPPGATGSAVRGLCNAHRKSGLGPKPTARRELSEAAGGPSNIPAFCAGILQTGTAKKGKDGTGVPHSNAKPTDHGKGKLADRGTGKPADHSKGKSAAKPTDHPKNKP